MDELRALEQTFTEEMAAVADLGGLQGLRIKYTGKKGLLTAQLKALGSRVQQRQPERQRPAIALVDARRRRHFLPEEESQRQLGERVFQPEERSADVPGPARARTLLGQRPGAPGLPDGTALLEPEAMSSRTVYLTPQERGTAPLLHAAIEQCRQDIASGVAVDAAVAKAQATLAAAGFAVDYVAARHAETLAPLVSAADGPIRLLVAARLGTTRLIDNIAA